VGLHANLPIRRCRLGDLPALAASPQSPPTPHRNRRQVTHRPRQRSQPPRELRLGRRASITVVGVFPLLEAFSGDVGTIEESGELAGSVRRELSALPVQASPLGRILMCLMLLSSKCRPSRAEPNPYPLPIWTCATWNGSFETMQSMKPLGVFWSPARIGAEHAAGCSHRCWW